MGCTNNDGAAPTCTCTTTPCPTTTTPCATTTTPCATTAADPCDTTAKFIGKYASKNVREGERLGEAKAEGAVTSLSWVVASVALVGSVALFVKGLRARAQRNRDSEESFAPLEPFGEE